MRRWGLCVAEIYDFGNLAFFKDRVTLIRPLRGHLPPREGIFVRQKLVK
jgi:hypothetical protein